MNYNSVVEQLRYIIHGSRITSLNSDELKILLSESITPEITIYLLAGLLTNTKDSQSKIDPNTLLINSILHAKDETSLIPIGFALRYKANPNLYVNVENIGMIHILAYTYINLNQCDPRVLNSIICMLVASGSKDLNNVFSYESNNNNSPKNDNNNKIDNNKNDNLKNDNLKNDNNNKIKNRQSVISWLSLNNYINILDSIREDFSQIDPYFFSKIATILDRSDLLDKALEYQTINDATINDATINDATINEDKKIISFTDIIKFHSNSILSKYLNTNIFKSQKNLLKAVKFLNLTAFEIFINNELTSDYHLINSLILNMKKYYDTNDGLSLIQTKEMLEISLQNGGFIDSYQIKILESINKRLSKEIIDKYNKPYWIKICQDSNVIKNHDPKIAPTSIISPKNEHKVLNTNTNIINSELKWLAYCLNINIDQSKEYICKDIQKIADQNPLKYKNIFTLHQVFRTDSNLSMIEEKIKDLKTLNKTVHNKITDDYKLRSLDIFYYKDENNLIWCFTSDMYDKILSTKKNPYTDNDLSLNTLDRLESQRNASRRIGFDVKKSKPIPEIIDLFEKTETYLNDKFTEKTNDVINIFNKLSLLNGVQPKDLESLTIAQFETLLKYIKYEIDLTPLSKISTFEHVIVTFKTICHMLIIKHPELSKIVFDLIKSIIKSG
jgi:hypothetical protein